MKVFIYFSVIIKQLSANDAVILKYIFTEGYCIPAIRINQVFSHLNYGVDKEFGYAIFDDMIDIDHLIFPKMKYNLILQILNAKPYIVRLYPSYKNDNSYNAIANAYTILFENCISKTDLGLCTHTVTKGNIELTDYGITFIKIYLA